jgi:argininosuccinate lyase
VRKGVPFREAHGIVAGLVRSSLESGRALSELTPQELADQDGALAESARELHELLMQPRSWIESKVSAGGTSQVRVEEQIAAAQEVLDGYGRA